MTDCPYCDWRYDRYADAVVMRRIGDRLPVVYDGTYLRVAGGSEAIDGAAISGARHICEVHPLEPEVLLLGPVSPHHW